MADELERLFRTLVRRVRDVRPENLSRPFEVAEILRTFVPYRANRADVGVETAEDYEVLVLRLLSGERGFMFADDAMQEDLRRELDSGNPDLRALHAYGTARVTLAQHAMRQVLESSPPASAASAAPAAPAKEETAVSELPRESEGRLGGGAARESHARTPDAAEVSAALESLQRQLPPTLAELDAVLAASGDAKPRTSFHARGQSIPDPTAEATVRTPRPGCRFCGQMLPDGRTVTFCPHCGQNLKVRRCPGCSAEVDPTWKFCVTCGRASTTTP
ncbi:MAG: zinc ribbon domain-containing protein [Gemmatimonadaceae bacterium]|nr:zinc ribbon domain-containing protein [Gemmatimonadaceae bacterium]